MILLDNTVLSNFALAMVRKMAYREGVRISGSIGVLITLVKMDRITPGTANSVLSSFIRRGYYSPTNTLDEFL
jgi:predicted nucleic acid-binding protein